MTANGQRHLKVFLNHAPEDSARVRDLYRRLRADGIEAWLNENELLPGQDWRLEISKAVREADVVVICMSSLSARKEGFVQAEINFALDKALEKPEGTIYIVPAKLEECVVPDRLSRWQQVKLFDAEGYEKLLKALDLRAKEIDATLLAVGKAALGPPLPDELNERLVPNHMLQSWLNGHNLVSNPFGNVDLRSHPVYPAGATRPNQWEAFLDPVPLLAHCRIPEDARALAFLLQKECLPLAEPDLAAGVNRHIFPLRVLYEQTAPVQPPLITLARSSARAWLEVLPHRPDSLLGLSPAQQNALLELLTWVVGSRRVLANLIQLGGLKEDVTALSLLRRIDQFENEFSLANLPQDAVLYSWLKIRPLDLCQTYLILEADDLLPAMPRSWFEQFGALVSGLFDHRIVTKAITCASLPVSLPLQRIELSWSDGLDGWLDRSLQGQFDAAMDADERMAGKSIRFHELFGPGASEKETTEALISASGKSLAHMLMLGNRLLQSHCARANPEHYLSPEGLDDILKIT